MRTNIYIFYTYFSPEWRYHSGRISARRTGGDKLSVAHERRPIPEVARSSTAARDQHTGPIE